MNEIRSLVLRLLYLSVEDVYKFDVVNLEDNVSEWNICARIAMYLENRMRAYDFLYRKALFKEYYVDVEYNRSYKAQPKIVAGHTVRVDLIIQTREETQPNYLVLEIKKPSNPEKRIDDERELDRMVRPREEGSPDYYNCGSFVGVFLDYNKDTFGGRIYWYDDLKKDVYPKDFTKDNMMDTIKELFG